MKVVNTFQLSIQQVVCSQQQYDSSIIIPLITL